MRLLDPLKRLSLLARILTMVGIALILTYPVSLLMFISSQLAFYRTSSQQELAVALNTMERSVGEQAVIGDYALIEQILRARVRQSHFLEIDFSDSDGNVVSATDPQPPAAYPNWFRSWFDLSEKPVSRDIVVGGKEYGRVTVWVSHIAFRNQIWNTLVQQAALMVGVGMALFFAVAWVLRRGLMPLRTATDLALRLRSGEYQCLASSPAHAAPEIRDTLETFNDAATREAWFARFAEIISDNAAPGRKVQAVMSLLCARLDMQGSVLAYQAATGGFTVKADYFANRQATAIPWEAWAAQVVAWEKPVLTGGESTPFAGNESIAYIGVPVHLEGYQGAVLSVFGRVSTSVENGNGELELMGLCADWIGSTLSQAEHDQRMHEQKAHAESVLNGVMEGIVTIDYHGLIISANPAMETIFAYPPDWIVGQSLLKVLPNLSWGEFKSRLALQAAHVGSTHEVWRETGKRSDGRPVLLEISARAVQRIDTSLTVVVLRDVTERIRAEESLQRSEARRKRALDIAQLGSLEYFPATGETHWSSELCRILGEQAGDRHSYQAFLACVADDDRERVAQTFEAALADGRGFAIDFQIVRPDGHARDVLLSAEPPERDERGSKFFAVVQDVTERKQAETKVQAALLEKLQAESHNRAKTLFLANMSHELRTPLNAILGYSDMLEEDARAEGKDMMVSDLQKIQIAGKHLLGMINEVLDLSKIEAGRMELALEDCAARPLLQEAVATVEPLALKNRNALQIECRLDDRLVEIDPMKFKQVIINLLSNACKFTSDGQVKFSAWYRDEEVQLWLIARVQDTGIGMTSEQVDRLFVPFVQADSSTSRKYGGTGLGLAISKRFIEMMGGTLAVTSEYGKGSLFELSIPVRRREPVAGETVVEEGKLRSAGA